MRVVSMMRIPFEIQLLTWEVTSMSSSHSSGRSTPRFATALCYLVRPARATLFQPRKDVCWPKNSWGRTATRSRSRPIRVVDPVLVGDVRSGRDDARQRRLEADALTHTSSCGSLPISAGYQTLPASPRSTAVGILASISLLGLLKHGSAMVLQQIRATRSSNLSSLNARASSNVHVLANSASSDTMTSVYGPAA